MNIFGKRTISPSEVGGSRSTTFLGIKKPSIRKIEKFITNDNDNDGDKPKWVTALRAQMQKSEIPLTSQNVKKFIPDNAGESYAFAKELAKALASAEDIRASIGKGEPKATLAGAGAAFIQHNPDVMDVIESFAQDLEKKLLEREECKLFLDAGVPLLCDLNSIRVGDRDITIFMGQRSLTFPWINNSLSLTKTQLSTFKELLKNV